MANSWIVEQIDSEISKLQQAKQLLIEVKKDGRRSPNSSTSVWTKSASKKRRTMTSEGRARIAAAQKARWSKLKKSASRRTTA